MRSSWVYYHYRSRGREGAAWENRGEEAERHLKAFPIVVAAATADVVKHFDLACLLRLCPKGERAKKLLRLLKRLLIVDTRATTTATTTRTAAT